MGSIFLLKIQGSESIPDYIQVRDDKMHLIAYFKAANWKSGLAKYGLSALEERIGNLLKNLDFGVITEVRG